MEILYENQVLSYLEYACLAWGGAGSKHLALLDRIQEWVARLIREVSHQLGLQTLQHRYDKAGLAVMFKMQQQNVPYLQTLRHPPRHAEVSIRAVTSGPEEFLQPRCRTWYHQPQFVHIYVVWWNKFLASVLN